MANQTRFQTNVMVHPQPIAINTTTPNGNPTPVIGYYSTDNTNLTPAPVFLPPRLIIQKQNCLAEEKFVRNGITQTVKVVVKNSPFIIQLGLASPIYSGEMPGMIFSQIDLHQFIFDAKLFYDTDEDDKKEVDFVKLKPLEFKSQVHENGSQVNMEVRLKVLTSQLEDMMFRVKIRALDARTKREVSPLLIVTSAPIKVVSKPEQLRKKKKSLKKRTLNDMMVETLSRIEQQQQDQQHLLNKISNGLNVTHDDDTSSERSPPETNEIHFADEPEEKRPEKVVKLEKATDFESAVQSLLSCIDKIPIEIRAEKMRKVIKEFGLTRESVSEMHDLFWAEGLQGDNSEQDERVPSVKREVICNCAGCPHKKELERVEDFYREVFSMQNPY